MEKTIKLIMKKDKSLKIYVNGTEKHSIAGDNRSISADRIYEIVDFSIGDQYVITLECEDNTDKQVLEYFKDLFEDIAKKVNALK